MKAFVGICFAICIARFTAGGAVETLKCYQCDDCQESSYKSKLRGCRYRLDSCQRIEEYDITDNGRKNATKMHGACAFLFNVHNLNKRICEKILLPAGQGYSIYCYTYCGTDGCNAPFK